MKCFISLDTGSSMVMMGQNVSVSEVVTSTGIRVNRSYNNDSVSLRSEAGQLYSELIVVQVGKDTASACLFYKTSLSHICMS